MNPVVLFITACFINPPAGDSRCYEIVPFVARQPQGGRIQVQLDGSPMTLEACRGPAGMESVKKWLEQNPEMRLYRYGCKFESADSALDRLRGQDV